jgi:dTDP-D-glucose 4,6-dehydratase
VNQKVQVSKAFLDGVWLLLDLLKNYENEKIIKIICKALQSEINDKYKAIERRKDFTNYKTAMPGTDEREALRQKYLESSYINDNWRSTKETLS